MPVDEGCYLTGVPGTLYVVATPIGNLEDITLRALSVLREVDFVVCEDTRVTRKLLARHAISTALVSHHAHSSERSSLAIVSRIEAGENAAFVTDAGTPLVSDPGHELVQGCVDRGVAVVPIPGPSAVSAALSACGLPTQYVLTLGFLPRAASERREILAPLRDAPYTLVLFEAPTRARAMLVLLRDVLGGSRRAVMARELTKRFETMERGTLEALAERPPEAFRGEIVIVVEPRARDDASRSSADTRAGDARAELEQLLASGHRAAEAAKIVASLHGLSKREAYKMVLALGDENGE